VKIKDAVARSGGRLRRMLVSAYRVYAAGLALDGDIYHLHDPELLPWGLMLRLKGKRVIYDAHEDLPQQILSKAYIPVRLRKPVARASAAILMGICARLDFVVAATSVIASKFQARGVRSADICNFPILGELEVVDADAQKQREVCYIGGISEVRGIREIVAALGMTKSGVRLNLGGRFSEKRLEHELVRSDTWKNVNALGYLDRASVRKVLEKSVAGLVTLLPTQAYRDSLPVKMFEYMSAGLPVIASDFPLWREIINDNECGLLVDPENPQAIADAIDTLVNNPETARRMGENGARAVREKYNWGIEEKKLLALYAELVGPA